MTERLMLCRAYLARIPGAIEGQSGDTATFRAACVGPDFALDEQRFWPLLLEWNARCLPPWRERDLRAKMRSAYRNHSKPYGWRVDETTTKATLTPRPIPNYPSRIELATVWNACVPIDADSEAIAWCDHKRLDKTKIVDEDLCRVLPLSAQCPNWAKRSGKPWSRSGHRLVVLMFDHHGYAVTIHSRSVDPDATDKAASPIGYSIRGTVMACSVGRLLLRGISFGDGRPAADHVRHCRAEVADADGVGVIIVEGVSDFLRAATTWGDGNEDVPATLGIIAGSWSEDIAARIPNDTHVIIATDSDPTGNKYADMINKTLANRCRVSRWVS